MTRFAPRRRDRRDEAVEDSGTESALASATRKLLLALGVFAFAWVVSRRLRSGRGRPTTDDAASARGDTRDRARQIPIEESGTAASERATGTTGEADEGLPGEDRSDEEIQQRAEPDVEEEPAPPGEMEVDEDVVEEIVDEDADERAETGGEPVSGEEGTGEGTASGDKETGDEEGTGEEDT